MHASSRSGLPMDMCKDEGKAEIKALEPFDYDQMNGAAAEKTEDQAD